MQKLGILLTLLLIVQGKIDNLLVIRIQNAMFQAIVRIIRMNLITTPTTTRSTVTMMMTVTWVGVAAGAGNTRCCWSPGS